MSRVIVYKGVYLYDVVNRFAEELGAGFEKMGVETTFVDFADRPNVTDSLRSALERPFDMIVAFGAVGCGVTIGDKSVYDLFKSPYVAVLIDHPAHHIDRLGATNTAVCCYDKSHMAFLELCFKGAFKTAWFPHAGCIPPESGIPASRRSLNLIFAGSYIDPVATDRAIEAVADPAVKRVIRAAVDRLGQVDSIPIHEAVIPAAAAEGLDLLREPYGVNAFARAVALTEQMSRALRRLAVLKALDDSGIAVNIFGLGWPSGLFKTHRVNGPANFDKVMELMAYSRMTLNLIMKPGSHERPLTAMLAGSVAVGDHNDFFSSEFRSGEDLLLYRWTRLDELPGQITEMAGNPERLDAIAASGRAKCLASHTWEVRARTLLELLARDWRTESR